MTVAFEKFMMQHNQTGSAKADGYSDDVFVGLAEDEKSVVFNLLLKELPWSAEWIFLVDRKKAAMAVEEKENELRGNGYEHVYLLQEQLIKYTGDLKYQEHMIEDYPVYIKRIRPLVVDSLGRTPANQKMISFLKEVILVEADASAVARASRHLLGAIEFPKSNDSQMADYRQLEKELRAEDPKIKQRALAKIEKYRRPVVS